MWQHPSGFRGCARLVLSLLVLLVQLSWRVKPEDATLKDWQQLDTSTFFVPKINRARGIVYYGSNERLRYKLHQLRNGHNLTISAIGGSITGGVYGEGTANIWCSRLTSFLNKIRTPQYGNITLTNGAVPGTISQYMSTCVRVHVPDDADIVLVEYANNDPWDKVDIESDLRKAYERLLRKLLQYPRHPAVVLVDSFSYFSSAARYWASAERDYLEFATYYHIPLVSIKACCFHLFRSGKPGWLVNSTVEKEVLAGRYPEETYPENPLYYMHDEVHPTSRYGHRSMAEITYELFEKTLKDLDAHPMSPEEAKRANSRRMHPPMISGNHASLSDKCLIGVKLTETTTETNGFEWINESKTQLPKWGYVGRQPGNSIKFKVNTEAGSGNSTGTVMLEVAHLKSYENMGIVEATCSAGCTCNRTLLDGHHTLPNSQTFLQGIFVSQAPDCVLEFKIVEHTNSGKHKFKITGITVSEQAGMTMSVTNIGAIDYVHNIAMRDEKGGRFDIANHVR